MATGMYEYLDAAWRIAMTGGMIKLIVDVAIIRRVLHLNGNGKRKR